jgi:hypothetical protein
MGKLKGTIMLVRPTGNRLVIAWNPAANEQDTKLSMRGEA